MSTGLPDTPSRRMLIRSERSNESEAEVEKGFVTPHVMQSQCLSAKVVPPVLSVLARRHFACVRGTIHFESEERARVLPFVWLLTWPT